MVFRNLIYRVLLILVSLSLAFSVYFAVQAYRSDAKLPQQPHSQNHKWHFVLISEKKDNPYWKQIEKGAKHAARHHHVLVESNGPTQEDNEKHLSILNQAIASKADGIITQGLNEDTKKAINKAEEHGIPVVTLDIDAPKSRRHAYAGTDNYKAGKRAAQTLIKDTGGKANVGIIAGNKGSANQMLRVKGFTDTLKHHPSIHVVGVKSSHISEVQAAEAAYEIFVDHPDVDAYYGGSALDGMGISAAMQSVGKTNDTYILASDRVPQTVKLIQEGSINATLAQKPFDMGAKSVDLLAAIKRGKNVSSIHHMGLEVLHSSDLSHQKTNRSEVP